MKRKYSYFQYDENRDLKLIERIKANDELALMELLSVYNPLIEMLVHTHVTNQRERKNEFDEFKQVCNLALLSCVKSFKQELEVKFSTFCSFCFKRAIFNLIRKNHKKNGLYDDLVYLDSIYSPKNGETTSLIELIPNEYPDDQADSLFKYNATKVIFAEVLNNLETLEQNICRLKLKGQSYTQISTELQCNYKKVDNTLVKFKRLVKARLKKEI